MTVPSALGYTVQLRKTARERWTWAVRLGGQHPYGTVHARGEAATPAKALGEAADALRSTPA